MHKLVTGAAKGSDAFWGNEVVPQIESRFGSMALSEVEKLNLRLELEEFQFRERNLRKELEIMSQLSQDQPQRENCNEEALLGQI